MNLFFSKKKLLALLFLFSLIFILSLGLSLVKQKQEVRKKAEEIRKEIKIYLNPQTNNQASPWQPNYEQTIEVKIKNITSNKTLRFRVVGLELNFNPQVFEILTSNLNCNPPFVLAEGKPSKVENNIISLVCYIPPGQNPATAIQTLAPGSEMKIGSFKVKVKPNSPVSSTEITFRRSNIPEEETLQDLSKYGENGIYYIATTSFPTLTSTPTISPPPTGEECPEICPNGENGNLNCDRIIRVDGSGCGLINSGDLTILLRNWSPEGPVPTPREGNHTADIVPDKTVNSGDLNKLLRNWKVE